MNFKKEEIKKRDFLTAKSAPQLQRSNKSIEKKHMHTYNILIINNIYKYNVVGAALKNLFFLLERVGACWKYKNSVGADCFCWSVFFLLQQAYKIEYQLFSILLEQRSGGAENQTKILKNEKF